jgi:uncharacterized membrane protein (GlpM family)
MFLYQLFTGEERRIPFIFGNFHFCRSRVIGLDMTENRIFTICRMITWAVFLRMFWNFISSLPVKRGGSLSFLTISRVIGLDMTENRIFTLCLMITWVVFLRMLWNFISSLPLKRGGSLSFLVGTISNVLVMEIGWTDVGGGISFNTSSVIFQLYHGENKLIFNEMMMRSALF